MAHSQLEIGHFFSLIKCAIEKSHMQTQHIRHMRTPQPERSASWQRIQGTDPPGGPPTVHHLGRVIWRLAVRGQAGDPGVAQRGSPEDGR